MWPPVRSLLLPTAPAPELCCAWGQGNSSLDGAGSNLLWWKGWNPDGILMESKIPACHHTPTLHRFPKWGGCISPNPPNPQRVQPLHPQPPQDESSSPGSSWTRIPAFSGGSWGCCRAQLHARTGIFIPSVPCSLHPRFSLCGGTGSCSPALAAG